MLKEQEIKAASELKMKEQQAKDKQAKEGSVNAHTIAEAVGGMDLKYTLTTKNNSI